MASPQDLSFPDASSPSLTLAHPRPDEQMRTWTLSHAAWGGPYTLAAYVAREKACLGSSLPLTPWILTDGAAAEAQRPVLASCETLRKRALVRGPDGRLRAVAAHGIASVFTDPACRRRGYARRMMALLGELLGRREAATPGEAAFSVLYSDIGRTFYADLAWRPFESAHLAFPVPEREEEVDPAADGLVTPVTDAELPALAQADERLVRARLRGGGGGTRLTLLLDLTTLQWHLHRQAILSRYLFGSEPTVHGALYRSPTQQRRRVWAVWTREQGGGRRAEREKNVLLVLRFVVEEEGEEAMGDEELAAAMKGILAVARREARACGCGSLRMWNPAERVKRLLLEEGSLEGRFVVREGEGIASMRWHGPREPEALEWLENEKFGWC